MYSANHAETVEELLQWPARRFEAFYAAFVKRRVVEGLNRRKEAMVQALWANSNYDDEKGTRENAIQEIETSFQEAIDSVNGPPEPEIEIDKSNPFFAAMDKNMKKLDEAVAKSDGTMKAVVEQEQDFTKYIDQS